MSTVSTVRANVETNNRKFERAFQQGDAARIAALYSEQARILPPGGDMQQGRAAIQAFWQAVIDSGVTGGSLTSLDVEQLGDQYAREVGQYLLTVRHGEETVQSPGKYVVIWKLEGGDWKLDTDIWNS